MQENFNPEIETAQEKIVVQTFQTKSLGNSESGEDDVLCQASVITLPNKDTHRLFLTSELANAFNETLQHVLPNWLTNIGNDFATKDQLVYCKSPNGHEFFINMSSVDEETFLGAAQFRSHKKANNFLSIAAAVPSEKNDAFTQEYELLVSLITKFVETTVLNIRSQSELVQAEVIQNPRYSLISQTDKDTERVQKAKTRRKKRLELSENSENSLSLQETIRQKQTLSEKTEQLSKEQITEALNEEVAILAFSKKDLLEDYQKWEKVYKPAIEAAEIIYIPPLGGIGDRAYNVYIGAALAKAFPDKEIIVRLQFSDEVQVYDQEPSNLKIISYTYTTEHQALLAKLSAKKTVVFNAYKDYSLAKDRYPIPQDTTNVTIIDSAEIDNPWEAWGYTVLKDKATELSKKQDEMISQGKIQSVDGGVVGYKRGAYTTAPQFETTQSKLIHLMGLSADILPNSIPVITPEKNGQPFDLVIVYDAKAGDTAKIIPPEKLKLLLAELYKQYPTLRVAVVEGQDHFVRSDLNPYDFPELTLIHGDLNEVLKQAWNTKLVLGVDTGLTHLLGAVRQKELLLGNNEVPHIVELMGLGVAFPADNYKAEGVSEVIGIPGLVQDLSVKNGFLPLVTEYLKK